MGGRKVSETVKRIVMNTILLALFLFGCSKLKTEENIIDVVTEQDDENDCNEIDYLENEIEIQNNEMEQLRKTIKEYEQIIAELKHQVNEFENEVFTSLPVLSPDETRLAYISPFEFELIGSLYLFDLKEGRNEKIFSVPENSENTIKNVKWFDNNSVVLIIGFGSGTVSKGGDLFLYNISKKEIVQLSELNEQEEIIEFDIKGNKVLAIKIIWDNTFEEYSTKQLIITIDE